MNIHRAQGAAANGRLRFIAKLFAVGLFAGLALVVALHLASLFAFAAPLTPLQIGWILGAFGGFGLLVGLVAVAHEMRRNGYRSEGNDS